MKVFMLFFGKPKTAVIEIIAALIKRYCDTHDGLVIVDEDDNDSDEILEIEISAVDTGNTLKEKLRLEILRKSNSTHEKKKQPQQRTSGDILKIIRGEITYFDDVQVRGKYLELAFQYLSTVRPISVESERGFSVAGIFCTKIRSRLKDESLDALCFLQEYFLAQKPM